MNVELVTHLSQACSPFIVLIKIIVPDSLSTSDPYHLVRMPSLIHFFLCNLMTVDAAPCIEYIGKNERNKNRNIRHCFKRKFAGTAIGQSQ